VPRPGSFGYALKGIAWSILAFIRRLPDRGDWAHGHGFAGWLTTSMSDPRLVLGDPVILDRLLSAAEYTELAGVGSLFERAITRFDPNDIRNSEDGPEGIALTPLAVEKGKRNGPREYVLRTQQEFPDRLTVRLHSLVTRVLFEGKRAIGVELRRGEHLYQADARFDAAKAGNYTVEQEFAKLEVILAAGAFNSPQLLKLSGIGPAEELRACGIDVLVDLPGVGENLQDRYEICVVTESERAFELLKGATFKPPDGHSALDPFFKQWEDGVGLYTSNGSLLGIVKRSKPELPEPDLYMFALPADFTGYKPGYSREISRYGNRFTWAILKAYTNNRSGRVTLRSKDPTEPPQINFKYFDEGSDELHEDLEALASGVEFVRALNERLGASVSTEIVPGPEVATRAQIKDFIRNQAWGHHASCTNKIGHASDVMAVLDSEFRVRGTESLRVVDASVFPRIPGYFIASAIYMISEKAAQVIARAGKQRTLGRRAPAASAGARR